MPTRQSAIQQTGLSALRATSQRHGPAFALLMAGLLLLPDSSHAQVLKWEQGGEGVRWAAVKVSPGGKTGFTALDSARTGIGFSNQLSAAQLRMNRLLEDGSGVAAGDVDGDGLCDLYFCRMDGGNVLYRNLGEWKFEDITAASGVMCDGQFSTGAVFADTDGDGDLDLLVNALGKGTRCFLNNGKGQFKELLKSGLTRQYGSRCLALADIDNDGDLDLYVANYRADTVKDAPVKVKVTGQKGNLQVPPEHRDRFTAEFSPSGKVALLELGEPDILYLNDGRSRFKAVSWTDGRFLDAAGKPLSEAPRDWGLAVMFRDINRDGAPDLYVCNDYYTPDRIWINQGSGTFRAIALESIRKTSWASMAVDFADVNRDGHDEFLVVDMLSMRHERRMVQHSLAEIDPLPTWGWGWEIGEIYNRPQAMRNTFFLNRGDHTYAEIAEFSGLQASEWSWGVIFMDVDLDGYEDVLVANGHARDLANSDVVAMLDRLSAGGRSNNRATSDVSVPSLATPNVAFRNQGDLKFTDMSQEWGFDAVSVSHGMCLADLDNDGDADVVINNLHGPALILRNDCVKARIGVRLKGDRANREGVGARVRVQGGPVQQSQEIISGGRYLAGDAAMRVFAAGENWRRGEKLRIDVTWPSGKRSVVEGVNGNRIYEIAESNAKGDDSSRVEDRKAFFEDVSEQIKHQHHEEPFNDYSRQRLLPRRLSQLGPGLAWCDLNGDGWEDLVIGSGRGGQLRVMFNNRRGGFSLIQAPPLAGVAEDDQTGILSFSVESGAASLLVGMANYETGGGVTEAVKRYEIWPGGIQVPKGIPADEWSTGALACGDIDGDKDIDLFVASRVKGGRYPQAGSSRVYLKVGVGYELDKENTERLKDVGLVSGAVWSDLDGDGFAELLLACEWGPLKVFGNQAGQLIEKTQEWGMGDTVGWWNGVTTGDFDGDGKMDIVASNWGRNSKYEGKERLKVFWGDLDGNETVEVVESYFDQQLGKEVPLRDKKTVSQAAPYVGERYGTYAQYSKASVGEVFGDPLKLAKVLGVTELESMLFLNRGGTFERRPLPMEAQLAPGFGVTVGDYDGDGNEDLFLSQNFFAIDMETSRLDAGRGLWMRGDGKGGLSSVRGHESGVKVYGEGRSSAVADYDGDGKVDLVVTQNGGPTKLYRNVQGKSGLRVRLKGPAGNANGVGAMVRLEYGEKKGPARELHGGSGYWSQDSFVVVLGRAAQQQPRGIWVRWPGGRVSSGKIPPNAKEIEVSVTGAVRKVR